MGVVKDFCDTCGFIRKCITFKSTVTICEKCSIQLTIEAVTKFDDERREQWISKLE